MKLTRYTSPAALVEAAGAVPSDSIVRNGDDWRGPMSWDQTLAAMAGRGCPDIGGRVGDMVRGLSAAMPAPPSPAWIRKPAGVLPSVPAYLAGSPAAMLDRRKVQAGPVRVVASLSASAMWDPEHMEKRGAAIAALVARLAQRRPVELWASAELGNPDRLYMVRIPTAPLDVAAVGYALAGVGVLRRLLFGVHYLTSNSDSIPWPRPEGVQPGSPAWAGRLREGLGLGPGDVYIPPGFGSPSGHPAITDPVRWVIERAQEVGR